MDKHRRLVMKLTLGGLGLAAISKISLMEVAMADEEKINKIEKTDADWKAALPEKSYEVLRHEDTERAFTSPLNDEHREGTFVCAGCALPLFPSKFKFNSGTGWPSFYDVMPGHIEEKSDYKIIAERTEYHCARCGGHQGHVFNDGPQPTGLRYCNNGVALKFIPKEG